tara:strand:+ start:224 stop:907 length:684 start_codon:yes stop_codon:yes gene_type:complete
MKKYLAHRGSWNENIIENTISAFKRTYDNLSDNSLHGFECDFQQLKTSIPDSWVIYHDDLNLDENTYQKYGTFHKNKNEEIPKLNDFCEWLGCIDKKIIINIEIKKGSALGIKFLINQLNEFNKKKLIQFIFSSFDLNIIKTLLDMKVKMGCLVETEKQLRQTEKIISKHSNIAFLAFEYDTYQKLGNRFKNRYDNAVYFKTYQSFLEHIDEIRNNPKVKFVFIEDR